MSTMNLGQIRQELYDFFGAGENPEPEVIRRFDQFINGTYKEIMSKKGMSRYRRGILPFSSVALDPLAVLPMVATRIITIQDRLNNQVLDPCDIQDIRFDDPGLVSSTSNPRAYAIINYAAALGIEPSAAAELFIKSTSALDTAVTAYLDGIVTGGYPKTISNVLTGTIGVSLDPTITNWIGAKKFYLSSKARGDITLLKSSGAGTELARIPQGRTTSRYTKIQLHPVPTAVVTYYADVEVSVDNLESQMDEPLFHEDYHWLLVSGAKMKQLMKDKDATTWGIENSRYKDGIGSLILRAHAPSGVGDRIGSPRFSQLGANFPAGS